MKILVLIVLFIVNCTSVAAQEEALVKEEIWIDSVSGKKLKHLVYDKNGRLCKETIWLDDFMSFKSIYFNQKGNKYKTIVGYVTERDSFLTVNDVSFDQNDYPIMSITYSKSDTLILEYENIIKDSLLILSKGISAEGHRVMTQYEYNNRLERMSIQEFIVSSNGDTISNNNRSLFYKDGKIIKELIVNNSLKQEIHRTYKKHLIINEKFYKNNILEKTYHYKYKNERLVNIMISKYEVRDVLEVQVNYIFWNE